VLNVEGKALGFIFIESTSSLSLLRHAVDEQVTVLILAIDSCFGSEVCLLGQYTVFPEKKIT